MPREQFEGFTVELPAGWWDITEDVMASVPTVARKQGVGALQFSIALHESGPRPTGGVEELQELQRELAAAHGLTSRRDVSHESLPRARMAATYSSGDAVFRVWHLSERGCIALLTYNCAASLLDSREFAEAEQIVRSLLFGDAVT